MEITIKELADELGVSKPTISKAIDALGIQAELRKVSNRFVLSETQAAAVKSQILQSGETETPQKPQEETKNEPPKPQSETEKSLISLLESQITILQEQLSAKDAQIATLGKSLQDTTAALTAAQDALQSTTAALTAAQALHAGTIQQQLTSASSAEQSEGDVISDTPSHPEPERKRGFFSRLFDKKR